jgi:multimeric flavodoxin WrbA/nitrite reductase/ring-hydroxylating ferredoxin subunit
MKESGWFKVGKISELKKQELQQVEVAGHQLAISYRQGKFGVISGECLHAKGPLGKGCLNAEGYVVCPWHSWMFHHVTGEARPGIPAAVPRYDFKEEGDFLYINPKPATEAKHAPHPQHSLARENVREAGPVRILGISTTVMNAAAPRYSTSDELLHGAMDYAKKSGAETKLIKLNDLKFRACEGYYSIDEKACLWPCSITQADPSDELEQIYEALVFWADVVLIATPIRWGNASSLYYKMAERFNCIQNQMLVADKTLIQNKVAAFIITGGQDNVQAVAGQMMLFFGELGFSFPQFPFVGHSRGWPAEDMENNRNYVKNSEDLHQQARALVDRALVLAKQMVGGIE